MWREAQKLVGVMKNKTLKKMNITRLCKGKIYTSW